MATTGFISLAIVIGTLVAVARRDQAQDSAPTTVDEVPSLWREIADSPLVPREFPAAVWTGREMIIWGGYRFARTCEVDGGVCTDENSDRFAQLDEEFADGAAYDPATDTWRMLSPAPIEGRSLAQAVWTGTEVIIWGGSYSSRPEEMGAAYDPATDEWRVLPEIPVAESSRHSLYWSGSAMFVFTSGQDSGEVNGVEVFRYDPTSDMWTELGSPGLHEARHITEIDGRLYATGYRVIDAPAGNAAPFDQYVFVSTIAVSADNGTTWSLDYAPEFDRRTEYGPMVVISARDELVVLVERVVNDSDPGPWAFSYDRDGGITERASDDMAITRSNFATRHGLPLPVPPVHVADDDIITFGSRGEISRGNPFDGWIAVGSEPPQVKVLGQSLVWADDALIIWGGREIFNPDGSTNTGYLIEVLSDE